MAQNDKKLCLGISGPIHHMIFIYGTHMKKDILWLFLHFLQILVSGVNAVVKGEKWLKSTKNYVCYIPYLRKHTSYYCDFLYTCVKWWHPQMLLFVFSKFWFLWLLGVGWGGGQGNTLWTSTKILQKIMAFQKLAQTFWSISCLFFKIILWNFRKTCYHGTDIANTICRFFLFGLP